MMTANHRKVVARYADGRLVKGYTFDFGPSQARFHVFAHPAASGPSTQVLVRELKAASSSGTSTGILPAG